MSTKTELETDVLLGRLCARIIKRRATARTMEVIVEEGGYRVSGRWEGKRFCIVVTRTAE